jgi:hypothetical protein
MGQLIQQDEGSFSVSAVAEAVGVCRDRFYELVSSGVFPPPAYDVRSRRPFYTHWLRAACLTVRSSGIGFDGQRVLFNRTKRSPRPTVMRPVNGSPTAARPARDTRAWHERFARQLNHLGLERIDASAVQQALVVCFPGGTDGIDDGDVLHRLRQHPWPSDRRGDA